MKAKLSIKSVILMTFLFMVLVVAFNVYDMTVDKSDRYAYSQADIKKLNIEKVNINTATAQQLCTLPSIGEKTANAIIEYRKTHGNYQKTQDIMNVRNIGEITYLKIRSRITV